MAYIPYHADWKDFPDTTTPITAAALEAIETGITAAAITADAAVPKSIVDNPGDLIVGNGSDSVTRLAIGAEAKLLGVSGGALAYVANTGTPGAAGATGATGPAGTGSASTIEAQLSVDTVLAASTCTLDRSIAPNGRGMMVAIGAGTSDCELRLVTGMSGAGLTLFGGGFERAHVAGDRVLFLQDAVVHPNYFGCVGDGITDDWSGLQRMLYQASIMQSAGTGYGAIIDGNTWLEGPGDCGIRINGTVRGLSIGPLYCSGSPTNGMVYETTTTNSWDLKEIFWSNSNKVFVTTGEGILFKTNGSSDSEEADIGRTFPGMRKVRNKGIMLRDRVYTAVAAAYTARYIDNVVDVDATGGARTITLRSAVGMQGLDHTIIKADASVNVVTVDGAGSETINGSATLALATQYAFVTVVSDGANWKIVNQA